MTTLYSKLLAAVGLLAVLGVLGITIYLQHDTILMRTAERDKFSAQVTQLEAANGDQKHVIESLRGELEARDAAATQREQAVKDAAQAADAAQAKADAAEAALRRLAAKDKGSVPCQALLTQDLAKVCPNIAQTIRERAK